MNAAGAALPQAIEHVRAGRLDAAEPLVRQVVAREPNNVQAWHLLGTLLTQSGRWNEAVDCFRQVVRWQSDDAAAHNNLGVSLDRSGQASAAVESYRRALSLDPGLTSARASLALALERQGQWAEAGEHYRELARANPHSAAAAEAIGRTLRAAGKLSEAVAVLQAAVREKPTAVGLRLELGNALRTAGQPAEAAQHYQQAIALDPNCDAARSNLGIAWFDLGKVNEAIDCQREVLGRCPDFADAHGALGAALESQGRYEEALPHLREAARLQPTNVHALSNLGVLLHARGELNEALALFDAVLRVQPDFAAAHQNRAVARLVTGQLREGFAEYEWRWQSSKFPPPPGPLWDGSPLGGRTILLHPEQGLGDTVQFVRYAPLVKSLGGTVVLTCSRRLMPLLKSCAGIDWVMAAEEPLGHYDVRAPLMSLPWLFQTDLDSIPADVPYLSVSQQALDDWQHVLGSGADRFRVGIAWQGNPRHRADHSRSFRIDEFAPLAAIDGVELVSLQIGVGSEQLAAARFPVVDLGPRLQDASLTFEDTGALVKNLDLLVVCDTALAHLAGALAVPVWMAVPRAPDWRWLLEREDSPWYPTMRLFRQRRWGQWSDVFQQMAGELARLVESGVR